MSTVDDAARLAERLGSALLRREATVTTAESCTGGWIAKMITDVPGSSAWFGSGFVTYSNRAKESMLGVETKLLEAHGAVSAAVVEAMAQGALGAADADFAVAVSGIAGPAGGTPEKPVGTVWLAVATAAHSRAWQVALTGDRESIRYAAATEALRGLLAALEAAEDTPRA